MRQLDHLVYAVDDLTVGIINIEKSLGFKPVMGGKHLDNGTHNALIHLGGKSYLEIIAIDPDSENRPDEIWMGLSKLRHAQFTRWALHSDDLSNDIIILEKYTNSSMEIHNGARQTTAGSILTWSMIMPDLEPEIDLIPFMVDWSASDTHPTDHLDPVCSLVKLYLQHPDPEQKQDLLQSLGVDLTIKRGDTIQIKAEIKCPNGIVIL